MPDMSIRLSGLTRKSMTSKNIFVTIMFMTISSLFSQSIESKIRTFAKNETRVTIKCKNTFMTSKCRHIDIL
jgi:hypothetical protein